MHLLLFYHYVCCVTVTHFCVKGINQRFVVVHLLQVTTIFPRNWSSQLISIILTSQPALHNFTTDIKEWFFKPSTTCATCACLGSRGKSRSPRWLEDTVLPFGSKIVIGAVAIYLLIMGDALIRTWLDAPESKIPHIISFLALRLIFGRMEASAYENFD